MILLIPPELGAPDRYLQRYSGAEIEEIEPRAGCRRFLIAMPEQSGALKESGIGATFPPDITL